MYMQRETQKDKQLPPTLVYRKQRKAMSCFTVTKHTGMIMKLSMNRGMYTCTRPGSCELQHHCCVVINRIVSVISAVLTVAFSWITLLLSQTNTTNAHIQAEKSRCRC